jgi:3-oxoacyl-[acyl-carrier protein] reductase
MKKRNVLLTGGTGGIGEALRDSLEENGYVVHAPKRAEMDLGSKESVYRFTESNQARYDILINNAGINELQKISDYNDDSWEKMVEINLTTALRLVRFCLPHMRDQSYGRILSIASIYGLVTREKRSLYGATKAALTHATRTLAVEEGKHGILANTLSPGFVRTRLTTQNNSNEDIERLENEIPLGRMASPQEIAKMALFLIDESNSYITGHNLVVDGGYTLT